MWLLLTLPLAALFAAALFARDSWIALVPVGVFGVAAILLVRRVFWRLNAIHDSRMRAAARHDARPPILLLRSFFRYGLAFRPSALKDYGIEAGCSYTEDVAIALEKIGRLVAIGGPDETIEMFEKHSLYFQSSETGWPEMFRLASSADAPDRGVLGNLALDTGGLLSTTWA